jgi:hypothetical protein
MQDTAHPRDVNQVDKLLNNYDQLVRVAQNLGHLEATLELKHTLLKKAIQELKLGSGILQAAVVSKVNSMKYPDEVYAKVLQLQNVGDQPVEKTLEYRDRQERNYERYLFVSNKYLQEPGKAGGERKFRDDFHDREKEMEELMEERRPKRVVKAEEIDGFGSERTMQTDPYESNTNISKDESNFREDEFEFQDTAEAK